MPANDLSQQQYHKMTETPIPGLILSLAAPTILSMLITSIYNLADTFFVGQLSTSASGAVGIVSSLMAIIQALGFMFGHGAGGIISRSLGNQDTHAATKFASTSFFTAMAVGAVLAVGNAPTALLTIAEKIENGLRPALVIGVPVGFVNVVESKERLFAVCESHGVPAIVAMGRKGGSNVAAAICNALIYSAAEMLDPTARGWK